MPEKTFCMGMRILVYGVLGGSLWVSAGKASRHAAPLNGFEVSDASVPVAEIRPGGPPRDGIPAIDRPRSSRRLTG